MKDAQGNVVMACVHTIIGLNSFMCIVPPKYFTDTFMLGVELVTVTLLFTGLCIVLDLV